MADFTENTAFLAHNDHDQESIVTGGAQEETTKTRASSYFKHPIKILTIMISVFSGLAFVSSITAFVVLQVGVISFISLVLAILMVVLQLPAIMALVIDIVLPVLTLIYSGHVFGYGWPERHLCNNRGTWDPNQPKIDESQCLTELLALRTAMGVAAGLGFIFGLLYLTVLLLRVVAISNTKFWKKGPIITPGAYTFSITMNVMKNDNNGSAHTSLITTGESQLIDA